MHRQVPRGRALSRQAAALYLGSINFSLNSIDHARELGVLLDDAPTVQMLGNTFGDDWNAAQIPVAGQKPPCGQP